MPVTASIRSRAILKASHRRWLILAVEAALVIGALWFAGPRIAALRIAAPVGAALLIVVISWVAAFIIEFGLFFAVSWDDIGDLLVASLRGSSAAMWFAPAILLLAAPSYGTTPSYTAAFLGLLLVANATRQLVARNAPQKLAPALQPDQKKRERFFRTEVTTADAPLSPATIAPVLGAFAIELGVGALMLARPWLAAALVAGGTALCTGFGLRTGTSQRVSKTRPTHWLLGILLTLLLTTWLAESQIQMQMAESLPEGADASGDPALMETMRQVWQQLEQAPAKKTPARKPSATRVVKTEVNPREIETPGADLAAGVIVRPQVRKQQLLRLGMPGGRTRNEQVTVRHTMTVPFTGEYRLFPTSSSQLKHEWAVEIGTLLEHEYATRGGGSLETEADQPLDPPVNLTTLGKIRLVLATEEDGLFAVSMTLVGDRGSVDLESEISGMRHGEETLEFAVPMGSTRVKSIHVAFQRLPKQGRRSMKVDIRRFELTPRGG